MKIIINLLFGLFILCIFSCKKYDLKKEKKNEVTFYFVEGIDTNYINIINNSSKCIFIPKDFVVMFTSQNDTLFLLQDYDSRYAIEKKFIYNKIFSDTFYLMKPLANLKPDSIIFYSTQEIYKNEFIMHSFDSLCFGEKKLLSIPMYKLSRNLKYAKIRLYKTQYDTLKRGFDAFHKFEKDNCIDLVSDIYY